MQKKVLALLLRGTSMGTKFLLMIALSKELSTSDYGVISLIVTTTTFFVFFLGFDFYNYSHREVVDNNDEPWLYMVNQFWFHTLCYLIIIPIVYVIFLKGIIPFEYLLPFYILLILEHLSQEIFRFFNLFNKPNLANITLFLRTAFWILLMFVIEHLWFQNEIIITMILYYWIMGSFLSILFASVVVYRSERERFKKIKLFEIDKKWIKKGVFVSFPFFVGTIAYKIIEYSDRYMIDWFLGKGQVGIYSFYTNFANIVNVVVNTIIISLLVPNLLRIVNSGNNLEIQENMSKFFKELFWTTILVSIATVILIGPTLDWLDKDEFSTQLPVCFVIILGNITLNFSLFYHFLLYAYKRDKDILRPALYAGVLNVILNIVFIPIFGIIAAAIGTLISFALILILKRLSWTNFKKNYFEKF